ncbi:MAG: hypothetical protein H6660_05540 [Ardenticatenaceae bacterium]|nr:hypothetical protein [Ardenticatenaceae bacterium]
MSASFTALALADQAFPDTRAFYSFEFRQIFILGLMLVATGTVLRVSRCPIYLRGVPVWLFMAAAALTLDLWVANAGFHAVTDPALLAYKPELVQWLQQQPGTWRITTFAPHGDKPFNANAGWLYDLQDVRGYDSIIPKQYADYMAAIEPQNELQYNRIQPIVNWESLNSPLLDVLNVKYIITAETIDLPKLRLAWEGDGLRVYENLAAAPRAYTLPLDAAVTVDDALAALTTYDPRQFVVMNVADCVVCSERGVSGFTTPMPGQYVAATISGYTNREVVVETAVSTTTWLILNDSYFPGWRAYARPAGGTEADEIELPINRVNGNFRGVLLSEGSGSCASVTARQASSWAGCSASWA